MDLEKDICTVFETDDLLIRRFVPEDWQDLYEYLSVDAVLKYLPQWECSQAACVQVALERSQGNTYWAVCLKQTNKMIGHIELHQVYNPAFRIFEIGYVFNPKFYGHGYATQACKIIMSHGFADLNAHRIIATCDPENTASWRLMERLTMRREAHLKKCLFLREPKDGQPIDWRDEYAYAILVDEWVQ